MFLGALVGLIMKMLPTEDIKKVESFSPTMFFLVLLPPIIFESGYNLHKGKCYVNLNYWTPILNPSYPRVRTLLAGLSRHQHIISFLSGNFFTNLGTILLFAIVGTAISALVVGGGIYLLGVAELVYPLDFVQSFAFGSLISAVDPVATLAIFQALDVDPVLNMLVFGESILNDAVAIGKLLYTQEISPPFAFNSKKPQSDEILTSVIKINIVYSSVDNNGSGVPTTNGRGNVKHTSTGTWNISLFRYILWISSHWECYRHDKCFGT